MHSQFTTKAAAVWAVAVLLALGCAPGLRAQATDGNLVGTVVDATGAAVPKATVVATNQGTGVKYSATSNMAGEFRVNNLPVGLYDVEATAAGMATSKTTNVSVELNRTSAVTFNMTVAGTTTTIEVAEAPALMDTSSSQLQATFKGDLGLNLPSSGNYVNDTGVLNLSLLAAGVTQGGGVGYGTGPSVGGQRQTNNSFNVDGVDNNRHDVTGPTITVPNDAVAEFSILQNQFSPEFGGSSGGIFNTLVKYGTNELHGSGYEYFQNRNLNAIDSKSAVQGFTSNPRFDYNRFGGTVGGPIKKNKLFYFVDWEYSPLGQASLAGAPIEAPTSAGYTTIAGLPGISKTNLGVLQTYLPAAPVANADPITVGGVKIPVGTVSVSGPSYVNKQNLVVAIDYNLSDKDQIRGRYIINRYHGIDTNAELPVFYSTIPDNRSLASISEFHNFSPSLLNELRVSYNRKNNNYPIGDQKFPGLDQFPNLTFDDLGGLQVGPDSSTPQGYIQGTLQATDNITKTFGKHTLKAGYQFFDVIATNSFIQRARGDYDYTQVDLYLHDLSPDSLGERSTGVAGGIPVGYLLHGMFVNDDFRLRPNLTVNLGVRYEYTTVPVVSRYQQFSSAANVPGLITFGVPQSQKNNWAPRLGFAYSPGKSDVWTVRGGFGINYDQTYNNLNINAKPGYFQQTEDVNLTVQTPNFLSGGGLPPSNKIVITTNPAAARAAVSAYNYDQTRPYAINWTNGVQRSFGKDYVFEARYLGTKGVHLYVQDQINRITDVTPSYSLPTFFSPPGASQLSSLNLTLQDIRNTLLAKTGDVASPSDSYFGFGFPNTITAYHPIGNSKYNGLALQLNKRYSKNFSYLTAFTWSHALDDSTATVFSTELTPRRGQDFGNLRNDWSSSSLDRRIRFTFTPTYDFKGFANGNWMMKNVVGNWNVSGTYTYQSPAYTTVQSGIDSNLNNDSAGDRSVINPAGSATLSSAVTGIDRTGAPVTSSTKCVVGTASITGANCTAAYVATNGNARYVQAGLGAFANAGRNTFPMNPIDNIDFQLMKRFAFTEKKRFEIGAQFTNLFNHAQWTGDLLNDVYPNQNNNTRNFLLTGNSNFGRFDQFFTSNPRSTTLVARFVF
jgi:hypothetical protein